MKFLFDSVLKRKFSCVKRYFNRNDPEFYIPYFNDALFCLTGDIVSSGGSYYLKDRTANGRDFLITDYDFSASWTTGIPYKSLATISAPVGDVVLIAADINNFLYDTSGTPNEIPVTSLFNDIDYEHVLFTRHQPQILSARGIETFEPRVIDITFYSTIKTGLNLTRCQTYYGVPVESLTAIWVSPDGNDMTGDGSKLNPVATVQVAMGLAGLQIYIKTGTYSFGNVFLTLSKNILGLGDVRFIQMASYSFYVPYSITMSNISLYSGGYVFFCDANAVPVFNKLKITGYGRVVYTANGLGHETFRNCIMDLAASPFTYTFNTRKQKITIDTCLINDYSFVFMQSAYTGAGIEIYVTNNRLLSTAATFMIVSYNSMAIKIIGNKLTDCGIIDVLNTNVADLEITGNEGAFEYLEAHGTGTGAVSIIANKFSSANAMPKFNVRNKNITIDENVIYNTGTGGFFVIDSGNPITALLRRNRFHANGDSTGATINSNGSIGMISGEYKYNNMVQDKLLPANDHGLQVLDNDFDVQYNRCSGVHLAFIYKGSNYDNSNSKFSHNVAIRGHILVKGVDNLNAFNNTCDDYSAAVLQENNAGEIPDNCTFKNNILQNKGVLGTDGTINIKGGGVGNVGDFNCIWSPVNWVGQLSAVYYLTFANWQAVGFEANGINVDPQLDADMIPAVPLLAGENLGATFEDGLDISTDWGDADTIPTVVLKKQNTVWQLGAYTL